MVSLERGLYLKEALAWTLIVVMALVVEVVWVNPARATTTGQTVLYFHKEPSDANETYNSLLPTPAVPGADTASGTTSTTNVNASPATSFCESSNNTGETYNQVSASAASTGERCIGTFISPPVGQAITMSTTDASAVAIDLYTSESASQATSIPMAYVYRWSGSGTTVATGDRIATFTGTDPGTAITHYAGAATGPANNITFAATDRIVVILSQNVTRAHTGTTVSNYFDNNSRSPSSRLVLKYTITTPSQPTLAGTYDDPFTTAATTTSCAGNPTFNTKWTCLAPSAANAAGYFNNEDSGGTGAGDTSQWLWLRNACGSGTAACTPSNFGTTPSNTFLYQSLPANYGDGTLRAAEESSLSYTVGATNPSTPYNHVGLVLWTSNTNYLEVQVYSDAAKGSANTAKVAFNNSGTLSATAAINSTVSNGLYNRIWLGFSKSGYNYQAQYSTDGTTWNNLGTAVNHVNFTRMGLNAYCAIGIASSVTDYGGAFNYFSYGFAPWGPTVGQRMRDGKWWYGGAEQYYWLN